MATHVRPTNPNDEEHLRALLARSFSVSPNVPSLRSDNLHWKYWAPRDDYREPRSFVLERGGVMVAHAAVWPLRVRSGTEIARGCHMIDWVSDPGSPGSGIALVQKFTGMFDFIYSIGGSAMTQKVLSAFGFKKITDVWKAGRPIRPWQQALTHQYRNWKLPARLVRNSLWANWPRVRISGLEEWALVESDAIALNINGSTAVVERPDGFFRYLKECPALRICPFRIERRSEQQGYVVLGFAGSQLRIAGIVLQHNSEDSLRAAHALIQKKAHADPSTFEVDAMGSTKESARAATSSGLRMAPEMTPVFLYRRPGVSIYPESFEMMDYDAVSRPFSGPAYWT